MRSLDSFIQSPICDIHFAGFRSTTMALQNAGWSISAHQKLSEYRSGIEIRLLLNHSAGGMTMMSHMELISVHDMLEAKERFSTHRGTILFEITGVSVGERSSFIADRPKFNLDFRALGPGSFDAIDAVPSYERIDLSTISLERFGVFRKLNDMANIYLPEKTVDELLKDILEKQAPKQAEIRKRERREKFMSDNFSEIERKPNESIKAQLIAV